MKQTSNNLIYYFPRPGTTREAELDVLADAYRFVLKEKAARPGGPDDAKGGSTNDSSAETKSNP